MILAIAVASMVESGFLNEAGEALEVSFGEYARPDNPKSAVVDADDR